jgi:membrane protein YqaA with SNARE-associated domain
MLRMRINKPLAILFLVISIVLPIFIFVFQDFFKSTQSLGLFGIFLTNLITGMSLIPAPGFLSVIAGGSVYPIVLVALVSALGATIGDFVFFIIGFSGRNLTVKKLQKKILFQVLEQYFKKYGGWVLFFASLVPNPIFDSFGLIFGIFGFSITRFIIIITIGRFLRFLILARIGAQF